MEYLDIIAFPNVASAASPKRKLYFKSLASFSSWVSGASAFCGMADVMTKYLPLSSEGLS